MPCCPVPPEICRSNLTKKNGRHGTSGSVKLRIFLFSLTPENEMDSRQPVMTARGHGVLQSSLFWLALSRLFHLTP